MHILSRSYPSSTRPTGCAFSLLIFALRLILITDLFMASWAVQIRSCFPLCPCKCVAAIIITSLIENNFVQGIKSPIVQLAEAGVIARALFAIWIGRADAPGAFLAS